MDQGVAEVPPCFVLLVPVQKKINSVSNVSLNLHTEFELVFQGLCGLEADQDVCQGKQGKETKSWKQSHFLSFSYCKEVVHQCP